MNHSPELPVEVVLIDLDIDDTTPVVLKIATIASSGAKVVVTSTHFEPNVVREALAAGALGYLTKNADARAMAEAISAASQGERHGSPRLSAQERRVMALYGSGEPVRGVALHLNITEQTAKSYLKRIREKYRVAGINVGTKITLRKRAIEDGILVESDIPRQL